MASRRRWSTSNPGPWRIVSARLLAAAACLAVGLGAAETFPPEPGARPTAQAALASGCAALAQGEDARAWRLLATSRTELGATGAWLLPAGLTQAALGRPFQAAALFATAPAGEPRAAALSRAALQRLVPAPGAAVLRADGPRWPGLNPLALKAAKAVQPGADGGLLLLEEGRLVLVGPDGQTRATQALPGAADLTLDAAGLPVALGQGQLFRADRTIPLPPGLQSAVSAAATPDGRLLVLDAKAGVLVVLDETGKLLDRKPLGLAEPGRVRVDAAGRVYVTERGERAVAVLRGGDLQPLRTVRPLVGGSPMRRIDDLAVDPFGCLLLVDARRGQIVLLSPDGRLLAETPKDGFSGQAAGWDGLGTLLFLDREGGAVGRLAW